jgi:transcriptional regulator with XRE-family HTH domain
MSAYGLPMSLGSQVRRYRLALGLTLEQLSEAADVDVGTISALEIRGSNRSQYGPQLARALGLSLEQLLDAQTEHDAKLVLTGEAEPHQHVVRLEAHSAWPFSTVSKEVWSALSADQRSQVEGFVHGLLASRKQPRQASL